MIHVTEPRQQSTYYNIRITNNKKELRASNAYK